MRKILVLNNIDEISKAVAEHTDASAVVIAGASIPVTGGIASIPAGILAAVANGSWPAKNLPNNVNEPIVAYERAAGSVIIAYGMGEPQKIVKKAENVSKAVIMCSPCEQIAGKEKWAEFRNDVESALERKVDENTLSSIWSAIAMASDAMVTFPFRLRLKEVDDADRVGATLVDVYKQWEGFVKDAEEGKTRAPKKASIKKAVQEGMLVAKPIPSTAEKEKVEKPRTFSNVELSSEEKVVAVCRFKFIGKRKNEDIAERLNLKVEEVAAICKQEKANKDAWVEKFRAMKSEKAGAFREA